MSLPLALAAVGMVMGGKTAIDGIKEGNWAKAILGGVGAYMGASGMASLAGDAVASSAGAASDAATSGATAAQNAATGGAATGATNAASDAATNSVLDSGQPSWIKDAVGGNISPVTDSATPAISLSNTTGLSAPGAGTASPGFLSKFGDWMHSNPQLAYGMMQIGGNMLSGYSNAEMQQKLLDQQKQLADEKRARIGYEPSFGFLNNYTYRPGTGWSAK